MTAKSDAHFLIRPNETENIHIFHCFQIANSMNIDALFHIG